MVPFQEKIIVLDLDVLPVSNQHAATDWRTKHRIASRHRRQVDRYDGSSHANHRHESHVHPPKPPTTTFPRIRPPPPPPVDEPMVQNQFDTQPGNSPIKDQFSQAQLAQELPPKHHQALDSTVIQPSYSEKDTNTAKTHFSAPSKTQPNVNQVSKTKQAVFSLFPTQNSGSKRHFSALPSDQHLYSEPLNSPVQAAPAHQYSEPIINHQYPRVNAHISKQNLVDSQSQSLSKSPSVYDEHILVQPKSPQEMQHVPRPHQYPIVNAQSSKQNAVNSQSSSLPESPSIYDEHILVQPKSPQEMQHIPRPHQYPIVNAQSSKQNAVNSQSSSLPESPSVYDEHILVQPQSPHQMQHIPRPGAVHENLAENKQWSQNQQAVVQSETLVIQHATKSPEAHLNVLNHLPTKEVVVKGHDQGQIQERTGPAQEVVSSEPALDLTTLLGDTSAGNNNVHQHVLHDHTHGSEAPNNQAQQSNHSVNTSAVNPGQQQSSTIVENIAAVVHPTKFEEQFMAMFDTWYADKFGRPQTGQVTPTQVITTESPTNQRVITGSPVKLKPVVPNPNAVYKGEDISALILGAGGTKPYHSKSQSNYTQTVHLTLKPLLGPSETGNDLAGTNGRPNLFKSLNKEQSQATGSAANDIAAVGTDPTLDKQTLFKEFMSMYQNQLPAGTTAVPIQKTNPPTPPPTTTATTTTTTQPTNHPQKSKQKSKPQKNNKKQATIPPVTTPASLDTSTTGLPVTIEQVASLAPNDVIIPAETLPPNPPQHVAKETMLPNSLQHVVKGSRHARNTRPPPPSTTSKPTIDPELLADINEARSYQGLPALLPHQVDLQGNILPFYKRQMFGGRLPARSRPNLFNGRTNMFSGGQEPYNHGGHQHGSFDPHAHNLELQHQQIHMEAGGSMTPNLHRQIHLLLRQRMENNQRNNLFVPMQTQAPVFDADLMADIIEAQSRIGKK